MVTAASRPGFGVSARQASATATARHGAENSDFGIRVCMNDGVCGRTPQQYIKCAGGTAFCDGFRLPNALLPLQKSFSGGATRRMQARSQASDGGVRPSSGAAASDVERRLFVSNP